MPVLSEFDIIRRFFAPLSPGRSDVLLGIGDDAAVLKVEPGQELVVSCDTLVAGVHFLENADAALIAYKALASNLSDLAAMGAEPRWFTLALTLPHAEENWLASFSQGLKTCADRFQIALVGGDTTRGPSLVVAITVMGTVPAGEAITRGGAKPGDFIFVTGTLGDAGHALHCLGGISPQNTYFLERYYRPQPRVNVGVSLRNMASAMIDISDGFSADLAHLLEASGVGATIDPTRLPLSEQLTKSLPQEKAIQLALSAGDDYELCFTVPPIHRERLKTIFSKLDCRYTCVGQIDSNPGLRARQKDGAVHDLAASGFRHF